MAVPIPNIIIKIRSRNITFDALFADFKLKTSVHILNYYARLYIEKYLKLHICHIIQNNYSIFVNIFKDNFRNYY